MKNKGLATKLAGIAKASLLIIVFSAICAGFMAQPKQAAAAEQVDLYQLMVRFNELYAEITELANQINDMVAGNVIEVPEMAVEPETVPEMEALVEATEFSLPDTMENMVPQPEEETLPVVEPDVTLTVGEPVSELAEPTLVFYTDADARAIAEVIHAEANGLDATQKRAVAWCVLNRVDDWGGSIQDTARSEAFARSSEYTDEDLALANEVLLNWSMGGPRDLPEGYYYFNGDGKQNFFRMELSGERLSLL